MGKMPILSGLSAMVFSARMSKGCPSRRRNEDIKSFKEKECQFIFDYILNHYGIEPALTYASKSNDVVEYNIQIDLSNIVYCEYDKLKQCNLFCPYFFGKCIKED